MGRDQGLAEHWRLVVAGIRVVHTPLLFCCQELDSLLFCQCFEDFKRDLSTVASAAELSLHEAVDTRRRHFHVAQQAAYCRLVVVGIRVVLIPLLFRRHELEAAPLCNIFTVTYDVSHTCCFVLKKHVPPLSTVVEDFQTHLCTHVQKKRVFERLGGVLCLGWESMFRMRVLCLGDDFMFMLCVLCLGGKLYVCVHILCLGCVFLCLCCDFYI